MINQSLCASATKQHIKISSFLLKFLLMLTKNAVIPSPINQLVSRGLHRAIHLPKISIWSLWLNSCGSLDTFCEDYLMILFRGFLCFHLVSRFTQVLHDRNLTSWFDNYSRSECWSFHRAHHNLCHIFVEYFGVKSTIHFSCQHLITRAEETFLSRIQFLAICSHSIKPDWNVIRSFQIVKNKHERRNVGYDGKLKRVPV